MLHEVGSALCRVNQLDEQSRWMTDLVGVHSQQQLGTQHCTPRVTLDLLKARVQPVHCDTVSNIKLVTV